MLSVLPVHSVCDIRTQSSGWLWDEDQPGLLEMSARLGRATKLLTFRQRPLEQHQLRHFVEAEAWQVGVYSPGGHYLPHFDDFDILDPQSYSPDGERIYSLVSQLFKLSDI